MHETHTQVTADGSKHAVAAEPERPAAGVLTVRTERRADVLVLWLSGALDRTTSALLDREFDAQAGRAAHVVVDLTGLTLIDSSGLATLLRAHRRAYERDQRTSFRQGPHAEWLPRALTPRRPPAYPAGRSPRECEHQRELLRARHGVR
jgi:anti-anti-sigma factor